MNREDKKDHNIQHAIAAGIVGEGTRRAANGASGKAAMSAFRAARPTSAEDFAHQIKSLVMMDDYGKLKRDIVGKRGRDLHMFELTNPLGSHYASELAVQSAAPKNLRSAMALRPFKKRYVAIPATYNPAIAAHELGHASSPMLRSTAGQLAYGMSTLATTKASPLFGLYRGARGEDLSTKEKATLLAVAAPMVIEETRANAIALGAMRRLRRGKPRSLKAYAPILGSELSYLAAAAAPFIAHKAAKTARDFFDMHSD